MRNLFNLTVTIFSISFICSTSLADNVTYQVDDVEYEGYYSAPDGEAKGQVLVIHDWDGLDDYERKRVDMLNELGYTAFAVDLYGKGNRPDTTEAKKAEVGKLYDDRPAMRKRILQGLAQLRTLTGEQATVVMGYCFGGAATLELARSGSDDRIAGYVTFHGGLKTPEGQNYSEGIAPILILHGGADSSVTMEHVSSLTEQLESAGVDYEIEIYSGAPHAFTVFGSERYQQAADEKSWASFTEFLQQQFNASES